MLFKKSDREDFGLLQIYCVHERYCQNIHTDPLSYIMHIHFFTPECKVFAFFEDFERTFPSVHHDWLWSEQLKPDICRKFIKIRKSFYDASEVSIRMPKGLIDTVDVTCGVLRGKVIYADNIILRLIRQRPRPRYSIERYHLGFRVSFSMTYSSRWSGNITIWASHFRALVPLLWPVIKELLQQGYGHGSNFASSAEFQVSWALAVQIDSFSKSRS